MTLVTKNKKPPPKATAKRGLQRINTLDLYLQALKAVFSVLMLNLMHEKTTIIIIIRHNTNFMQ